jgi:hypothetical protein
MPESTPERRMKNYLRFCAFVFFATASPLAAQNAEFRALQSHFERMIDARFDNLFSGIGSAAQWEPRRERTKAALERMLGATREAHKADAHALGRVFVALRRAMKPTVAAVQGSALAGGAGLANACDLVLAHEGASFGYPEVRIGFVPAMVMTMLRRSVGEKRAAELVLTGPATYIATVEVPT